jgi:hypothetical protein
MAAPALPKPMARKSAEVVPTRLGFWAKPEKHSPSEMVINIKNFIVFMGIAFRLLGFKRKFNPRRENS